MNNSRAGGAVLVMAVAFTVGCGGPAHNSNDALAVNAPKVPGENENNPKTNVEELGLLVNMPYEVDDELVWKDDAVRKRLIAVMHFSKADAERVVSDASGKQPPQNVTIPSESWFPAELIAQGEMSGDDALNGTAYGADAFFMEPYRSGRIVRIAGTDYFVLQLSAK